MGTAGVSLSQVSNPRPLSMARYFFVFNQSFSRCWGSDCMISREAWAQAAWVGLIAALKIVCLEWVRRNSMTSLEAATNPPVLASDLDRLPQITSDRKSLVQGKGVD